MWSLVSDIAEYKIVASCFTAYVCPFIIVNILIQLCIVTFRSVLDTVPASVTCSAVRMVVSLHADGLRR